jgi:formate hydrogenlyase subunit 4
VASVLTGTNAIAGLVQVVGAVFVAPLIPGVVQWLKARLQGRRGASPLQPYRELARLWRKSVVDPEGTGPIYRSAPAVVAASLVLACLLVPIAGRAPDWPVGHDALVLLGFLALARFAVAAAAWDTGSGFALQGASRDLAIGVAAEAVFILTLATAAVAGSTTDLRGMAFATAGGHVWSNPAQTLALLAFLLVILAETGRQPVDNPDTHLELTMIHEGPLLEYAGRDLALLQWATAARHWLVLALAAGVFLPHPSGFVAGVLLLPIGIGVLAAALAVVETLVAKMRILLVPGLLGVGAGVALLAVLTRLVEAGR